MPSRLLLAVLLAAPAAALAQPAPGTVAFSPDDQVGIAECQSTTASMVLEWTAALDAGSLFPAGGTYSVLASSADGCPAAGATTGTLASGLAATALGQSWPGAGDAPLRPSALLAAAGVTTCTGSDRTVHVCVRLLAPGGATVGGARGTATAQLALPVAPTLTRAAPGDQALTLEWTRGATTSGAADAASYRAFVAALDPAEDPTTRTRDTASTSVRVAGLRNGVTYRAVVRALSLGGNESADSNALEGTPVPVKDFFDMYQEAGGVEQGCSGGAAGAASLLALLAAAGLLRRRP